MLEFFFSNMQKKNLAVETGNEARGEPGYFSHLSDVQGRKGVENTYCIMLRRAQLQFQEKQ